MSEHNHNHTITLNYGADKKLLLFALSLTLTVMLLEFAGGILSNSLALISDAVHMLTDTGALSLALFTLWFSRKPATAEKTYGFYRFEILAALLNGSILIVMAGYIFHEAFLRLLQPAPVQGVLMLAVAGIGLAANLAGAFVLSKGSQENLNISAALWHMLSDTISSAGVILGGVIIIFTGFLIVDPLIGFLIGIIILWGAWRIIRESADILLEATPRDINLEEVIQILKNKVRGIRDIHDLHIWTITSGLRALSAHVLIEDIPISSCADFSQRIKKILKERFKISHATLEFECLNCEEEVLCRYAKEDQ